LSGCASQKKLWWAELAPVALGAERSLNREVGPAPVRAEACGNHFRIFGRFQLRVRSAFVE
jgi:hypothetical protein